MEFQQKPIHNEERQQSMTRVAISLLCFVLLASLIYFQGEGFTRTRVIGLGVIGGYIGFALAWRTWVIQRPEFLRVRVPIAMVMDVAVSTLSLHLADKFGSFFYPIYLWVVVGYGLRYGRSHLAMAAVAGCIGFGLILKFSSFWQGSMDVGVGLLVGIIVLPTFFMTVLKRLNRLNDKLAEELIRSQAAEQAKGDFLASMSHEIRTPLNGVIGVADMLRDAPLPPEHKGQVEIIVRSGEALLSVINDVLDFSKINAGQLSLESVPFDLKLMLEDLVALLGVGATKKGLTLDLQYADELPRGFRGDPTRIRQILTNLVGNGIKFTSQGKVILKAGMPVDPGTGETVLLQVIDSGVGIPADRLAAIFDPFEQADRSTTREFGGTGLGLSISQKLANLMGGQLEVDSDRGHGSTFSLSLSLPVADVQVSSTAVGQKMPKFGFHALLVEDHRVNQMVATKLLSKLDITVDLAENGAIALEKLDPTRHDLIFMDLHMPVMNGWDATRKIRERQDGAADLPIVALTADADVETAHKALEAGMDAHLPKPLRITDVVKVLESLAIGKPANV